MGLLRSFGLDSVGDRVGRYLYSEKKVPSGQKDEQIRMEKQASSKVKAEEMQDLNKEAAMHRTRSQKSLDEEDHYEGPDTSSLAAFLFSLLSYSPQRGSDVYSSSSGSDDEYDADHGSQQPGAGTSTREQQRSFFGLGFSRKASGGRDKASSSQEGNTGWTEARETASGAVRLVKQNAETSLFADGAAAERIRAGRQGEDLEAEWHLVYEGDLTHAKNIGSGHGKSVPKPEASKTPNTPRSPFRLPEMSEESSLLTEASRLIIYEALPALARGREWVLLYSNMKHGMSLLTLYRRSELASGPCLLVVGDKEGAVFGGLSSGPLKPSTKKKYQGTSECFVFSDVDGTPRLYRATGANRYFVLCMNDALALGGGGHFALMIDGELLHGTSGYCETYGSACLARSEDFMVKRVELWGFAHASRYAPKGSAWHEPEAVPGIHTW